MKHLKKFESFINEAGPAVKEPETKPDVKPGKPATKPSRPSPIRRTKPNVTPKPKAGLKKATAEQVAERFLSLKNKNR